MAQDRLQLPLFDILYAKRIYLRPYRLDDAADLFAAISESRDHLRPWLPFADAHQTIVESRDWIAQQQAAWQQRTNLFVGIWTMADQHFIGGTGLEPVNWAIGYFQIGYWVRASAARVGYISEAVQTLADYALADLQANRVEIRCSDHNHRSAAVAQRTGFSLEGVLRNDHLACDGQIHSSLVFARTPSG